MKKNQTQILEMLDWKSVKEPNNISSLNEKVDNLEKKMNEILISF